MAITADGVVVITQAQTDDFINRTTKAANTLLDLQAMPETCARTKS